MPLSSVVRRRFHILVAGDTMKSMTKQTQSCPKCGQQMEEGFILLELSFTNYVPSVWVEGAPEPSFWTITKVKNKTKRRTVTYRCVGCGYLESYANEELKGRVKPE